MEHVIKRNLVHQGILEDALNKLFVASSGQKNVRKDVSLKHPITGKYLEVDVWYPELKLCFEYQDEHHYRTIWYFQKSVSSVQHKDDMKKNLLLQRGETLIFIPCWWDGSSNSLQATIAFYRPDLLPSNESENIIPTNPPRNFFPEYMQLMLASFQTTIEWSAASEWWLGEKYDGVRCCWNPEEKQMHSRHGLVIETPPSLDRLFGRVSLDSEIWCGRGLFLEANYFIQASIERLNWSSFRIVCFDEASRTHELTFEQRYSLILSHIHPENPATIIAPRFLCTSSNDLSSSLMQVVEEGGEGVILRKPLSLYQPGRSGDLIKYKGSRGDQEALVVDVEPDGSLLLQLPDGVQFLVPKSDCVLHRHVVCGDVVSFTHDFATRRATKDHAAQDHADDARAHDAEARAGLPSNPVVYRLRDDLSWEDVLRNSSLLSTRHFLNEPHQKIESFAQKHISGGHKIYATGDKYVRGYLEYMARKKGFDPLIADNWYRVPNQEFLQHWPVRRYVDSRHSSSWAKALIHLFPDLSLRLSNFSSTHKYAKSVQNRRELLEKFARAKGGDPLDPKFWYSVRIKELLNKKGYVESVMHVFPELRLSKSKFKPNKVYLWKDAKDQKTYVGRQSRKRLKKKKMKKYTRITTRKDFFDRYASSNGFDPLDPTPWYNVSIYSLSQYNSQGTKAILGHYNGKLSDCLIHLYPDIGLQKSKFSMHVQDRKAFFENFAKLQKFDPLFPDNWYSVSPFSFSHSQEYKEIVQYYKGELSDCLIHLYPDIGLQKSKFTKLRVHMRDRKYFDNYARTKGFDPLIAENWYTAFSQYHEYKVLLKFFRGKLSESLMQLYPNIGLESSKFKKETIVR